MRTRRLYNCQAGCPVENTLQFIAGKWKSVILYHLLKNKVLRFNELESKISGCSKRMLALQLKELEADHIIHKTIYPVIPPKTEYQLTDLGQTLEPVIMAMEKWGESYRGNNL
ncbi:winged helix-turn-helix transcriptional regulator [Fructilactobacillus frigidiflavus]|uniref:winged helix-turn-helix transcriptional regulator n=1 Tax=Fructilactobacillus frigidiflavus TaxID=3242688 RepID=UPI0037564BD2